MPTPPPELPAGRITLEPPPSLEAREGVAGILTSAVPMLGSLGSVVIVASMATQSGGQGHRSMLAAGMFLLGTLGFVVLQVDRQRARRRRQQIRARRGYLRHLGEVRHRARRAAGAQRRALRWHHPPPATLPGLAAARGRVWERTPEHPYALEVRYAEATAPLAVELTPPEAVGPDEPDPVAADALHRLLATHARPDRLPLTLSLAATRRVVVDATDPEDARALARSLLCQAATFHPPGELAVAVLATEATRPAWEWLKWLPHAHSAHVRDALGPRRLVAGSAAELAELLPEPARLLLVLDGCELPPDHPWPEPAEAVTVVDLGGGTAGNADTLRLLLTPGDPATLTVRRGADDSRSAVPDLCDPATAAAVARRLLPLRAGAAADRAAATDPLRLLGLAGPDVVDPAHCWAPRGPGLRLRVPLGVTGDGSPLVLDLKESARGGVGPHGLLVGATGSGKSELLRTLVLGLALTHPPERLQLVLVDFKGGATFAGLAPLPHVAAMVTNLADDLALVDRMQDALAGELVRRQEVLRRSGDLGSVHDLEAARDAAQEAGADLPSLPPLLVVVDEFSEMLTARPEFLDLFTAIGRLGRSLGIHLLLASQRLDEGRLRGLESHLSYRIGLRTFSAAESRTVLGVADAADLPAAPGVGFLRTGPDAPVRFQASYVSGPVTCRPEPGVVAEVVPFTLAPAARDPDPAAPPPPTGGPSLLDLAVSRLAGHGTHARQIWLPPLDLPEPLGALLGDLIADPGERPLAQGWTPRGLVLPVGLVDRPREQRRDAAAVDLSGAGGHVAVVGGPRSGRTTLLQTLVAGLALTSTPWQSQVFVIDLGGGGLAPLAGLPHVSAVATGGQPDLVRRVVTEVGDLLDRREEWWAAHDISGIDDYRDHLGRGLPGDGHGEVFLVVDGWATLRTDHDDLETAIGRIAARGLALGVHVLLASGRWAEVRSGLRDLLGSRLELRLGDPVDSEVDRRTATLVPHDRPGRGLTTDGLHFLAALPRLDADGDLPGLVARVAEAWPGPPAPRLRLLPAEVSEAEVRAAAGTDPGCRLLLGLDERLAPVALDPTTEPHLTVLGDRGSGRSTTLRAVLREVVRTRTPAQAQVVLLDPRRTLVHDVPPDQLLAHHLTATAAAPAMVELAGHLAGRLPAASPPVGPAPDHTARTEVFVVVDDVDLLGADSTSALAPLLPLLPHATDLDLHLVLAHRIGPGGRGPRDPVLGALEDLGAAELRLPSRADTGLPGRALSRPGPPGRGRLTTRDGGAVTLQVTHAPPAD